MKTFRAIVVVLTLLAAVAIGVVSALVQWDNYLRWLNR